MRVAALLLASCLAAACAPAPASVFATTSGDVACWWRDVRWEDAAPLLLPGTRRPVARALSVGSAEAWRGARVSAVLQDGALGTPVLRGTWRGGGLSLFAEVDAHEHGVLRAWAPTRLGAAGLLPTGARVRVVDARDGALLVTATADALEVFEPAGPEVAQLSCDAVTLLHPAAPAPPLVVDAAVLPAGRRVVAHHQPGGSVVGAFVARAAPTPGVVLERDGTAVRFAASAPSGAQWIAWVPEGSLVRGATPVPVTSASLEPAARRALRACDVDQVVSLRRDDEPAVEVGQLRAGTPFSIEGAAWGVVPVRPSVPWLELAPGVQLLLPEAAAACPALADAP